MTICPFCGAENIQGSDLCDQCQHSLTTVDVPVPATPVEKGLLRDRIEALQPKKPATVSPDTPIAEVLKKMVAQGIGCVLVTDAENRVLGIFSERDALLKLNIDAAKLASRPVSTVMTADPATLNIHDKIAYALQRMNVGGFRHLPILDNGQLVGVISIRDILGYLTARHHARA